MLLLIEFDRFSRPVAIFEILAILSLAVLIGWLIARIQFAGAIQALHESILYRKTDLLNCRRKRDEALDRSMFGGRPMVVENDLKRIEGIGPKIEILLKRYGIGSFEDLAQTSPERIMEILRIAGPRFQIHDPTSWPIQAALARDEKWNELEALQARLNGGKE